MKNYILLSLIILMSVLFCGCNDFYPTNSPRETVTMKENYLTTVTFSETSRAETYSEYISSLKEASADTGTSVSSDYGGLQTMDTGWLTDMETILPAEAVTAVTSVTSVTEVTSSANTDGSETETTTVTTTTAMESVTALPFDIADIPAVPSEAVSADTAVSPAN